MLTPPAPTQPSASEPPSAPQPSGDAPEAAVTESSQAEEPEQEPAVEEPAEQEPQTDLKAQKETLTPEVLGGMTVKDLRTIARDLNITNMTRKEIRFGKKEDLIASICKYLEQEC